MKNGYMVCLLWQENEQCLHGLVDNEQCLHDLVVMTRQWTMPTWSDCYDKTMNNAYMVWLLWQDNEQCLHGGCDEKMNNA